VRVRQSSSATAGSAALQLPAIQHLLAGGQLYAVCNCNNMIQYILGAAAGVPLCLLPNPLGNVLCCAALIFPRYLCYAMLAGSLFISYTIKTFGALVFAIIMTTRQFLSILLSSLFFGSPLTGGQW
jgi:hypothetical protein